MAESQHQSQSINESVQYNKGKTQAESVRPLGWQKQTQDSVSSHHPSSFERKPPSPRIQPGIVEKNSHLVHHNEILGLNEKVLEKEEIVLQKDNEINLYRHEIESLRNECGKLKSILTTIELHASELQRTNDILTQEIKERNTIIQELQSADLGMKTQLNIVEFICKMSI